MHIVLQHLQHLPDNEDLDILALTKEAIMLILLVTAGRGQDMVLLDLQDINSHNGGRTCLLSGLTKTTRPGSQ